MTPERASMIGWREWISLPRFSPTLIKAKVDTGANTSSLHAHALTVVDDGRTPLARFELLPEADSSNGATTVTAPIVDFRTIRSSNGQAQRRPVIRTEMNLGEDRFELDLTLTSRDAMGHRMLLGRRFLEDRFLVDPARSYLLTTGSPE